MKFKLDGYTVYARIYPVLITVLPVSLMIAVWVPSFKGLLWSASVSFCLFAIIAQVGRDLGKIKEASLFKSWGGTPTTRALRHRDTLFSSVTLERYHKVLSSLVPNIKRLPLVKEEAKDPAGADQIYLACIDWLKANTRDKEKFSLLYEENKNYGFRRNLWGLKPLGVFISISSVVLSSIPLIQGWINTKQVAIVPVTMLGMDVFLGVFWIFYITPTWVRIPAEEYAKRLLEACDQLKS